MPSKKRKKRKKSSQTKKNSMTQNIGTNLRNEVIDPDIYYNQYNENMNLKKALQQMKFENKKLSAKNQYLEIENKKLNIRLNKDPNHRKEQNLKQEINKDNQTLKIETKESKIIIIDSTNKIDLNQNEMKDWLEKNYKGENKSYLEDVKKSEQMFEYGFNARRGVTCTISMVSQNISKRMGSNNMYSNSIQNRLQDNYRKNYTSSQAANIKKK